MKLDTRLLSAIVAALAALALTGCGSGGATPALSRVPSPSPVVTPAPTASHSDVGSVGPFAPTGCPADDPAFCAPAAAVADAIVAGDAAAIAGLSRPDVFVCKDVDATIFAQCASAATLEGHPVGTVSGRIDVLSPSAYRDAIEARTRSIDRSFRDDSGTGEARVLGTSTCGPDDPARRSHYVAWTAAMRQDGGAAERMVGLYEFTFRDDRWLVGILYLDTVAAWQGRHAEPLQDVGCGVTPWGAG